MIKFLLNPWFILTVITGVLSIGTASYLVGRSHGENSERTKQEKTIDKAEKDAAKEIIKTKEEAQIVYKYIKSQNDNCDIYGNVIDRLPNPASDSK